MNAAEALARARDLERAGRLGDAEAAYRAILARRPGDSDALHLLGVLVHRRGQTGEAITLLEKASKRAPRDARILNNLGQLLKAVGRLDDAEKRFRRAVAFQVGFADGHNNLGTTLSARGRDDEAIQCFQRALEAEPGHALATYNLAALLLKREIYDEAISLLDRFTGTGPIAADARNNLGFALYQIGESERAEKCFRKTLADVPAHVDAMVNMGRIHADRHDPAAAEECFRRAVAVRPDHARALANLGTVLQRARRSEEALAVMRAAHAADPAMDENASALAMLYLSTCAWSDYAPLIADLDARTRAAIAVGNRPAELPFLNICRSADPEFNFRVAALRSAALARRHARHRLAAVPPEERKNRERIVLGYLSADFRNHAVGQLAAPLFGLHDRSRFQVRAYSAGPDDGGEIRKRIAAAADAFTDIRALDDRAAAERVRVDGVDILIDLGGYTEGHRLGVAARRPAPVAVDYLGFAGTIGGDIFDYTIVDPIVVPPASAKFYSEKLIVVPPCYLIHDREAIAPARPSRADEGLPDGAFVFCSFNEARKLTPGVFDAWMNLLRDLPGAVLWLYRSNDAMVANLNREAAARGIDPARLIFARRRPKPEHLARIALADLALDTMPFNGGVTTSDVLWAGVPVITARGTHCASLGSASKLAAIGLPELVADDFAGYLALARHYARAPDELATLKKKLAAHRLTTPLFDSARFVATLEQGLEEIFRRYRAGEPPRHVVLDGTVKGLYGD